MNKNILAYYMLTVSTLIFSSECPRLGLKSLESVDLTVSYSREEIDAISRNIQNEASRLHETLPHITQDSRVLEAVFKLRFLNGLYARASNENKPNEHARQNCERNVVNITRALLYGNCFSYSCPDVVGKVNLVDDVGELKKAAKGSLREVVIKALATLKTPNDCPLRSFFSGNKAS